MRSGLLSVLLLTGCGPVVAGAVLAASGGGGHDAKRLVVPELVITASGESFDLEPARSIAAGDIAPGSDYGPRPSPSKYGYS